MINQSEKWRDWRVSSAMKAVNKPVRTATKAGRDWAKAQFHAKDWAFTK